MKKIKFKAMSQPTFGDLAYEIESKISSSFGKKKLEVAKPIIEKIKELKKNINYDFISSLNYKESTDLIIAYYQYFDLIQNKIPLHKLSYSYHENIAKDTTYLSNSNNPKHEMNVILFNLVHVETAAAEKSEDFQERRKHLKNSVTILKHIKENAVKNIKGYNIDLSEHGLDFLRYYLYCWMYMNAYEHMKAKQDIDLLCQLSTSISESAASSIIYIDQLIANSKSDSYFAKMLGQTDYISESLKGNMVVLREKYKAFSYYYKAISKFHIAEEKVAGYGEVCALITKAVEQAEVFKKKSHKCSIKALGADAEKVHETIKKKYDEYITKNKKIWKENLPIKFEDPEGLNTPLETDFNELLSSYIASNRIDDSHLRIVNVELVPAEVQEYINMFKLEDEPKHVPVIAEFQAKVGADFNAQYQKLNLPMCLSYMHQGDSGSLIPDDLKNRLRTAKSKGNLAAVEQFFAQLQSQEDTNNAMIAQLKKLLEDEKKTDDSIRTLPTYTGRIPSETATKIYYDAIAKFEADSKKAHEANEKLKKMFEDDKRNFELLFLGESEFEEKFESFKPKKANEEELKAFSTLKDAYDSSVQMIGEIEKFRTSMVKNLVEQAVNENFESIIAKHNSGGALKELSPELHQKVAALVSAQLLQYDAAYQEVDLAKHFAPIRHFLQPGDNSSLAAELKRIYESYDKYMQLNGYLSEGQQFYVKLSAALAQYYQMIYDFTYARNLDYMSRQGIGGPSANYMMPTYQGTMYSWSSK